MKEFLFTKFLVKRLTLQCLPLVSRPIIGLFLFLFFNQLLLAQDDSKTLSYRKLKKKIMQEQIIKLKNNVLLVRLKTKNNSINGLKEIGKNELAENMQLEQNNLNKEIIAAFKNKFTFCPVYFFYSNYSDSVRMKHLGNVVFLNDNLQPDSSIKPNNIDFLTAEFGNLLQDTAKYLADHYFSYYINSSARHNKYYGGTDTKIPALRIMSGELIQLKKPFPYYTRASKNRLNQNAIPKAVMRMNKKLIKYYIGCLKEAK